MKLVNGEAKTAGDVRSHPPAQPEGAVVVRRGFPFCKFCRRRLQRADQWRCPYVGCRVWLRGSDEMRGRAERVLA